MPNRSFTEADLATYLQSPNLDAAGAATAWDVATALVRSYTRGRGFDPLSGAPGEDLTAVILTCAARMCSNPELMRAETFGAYSYTAAEPGFTGWTLAEQAVLNNHRRRSA